MGLAEAGVGDVDALPAAVQFGDEVGHGVCFVEAALCAREVPGLVATDRAGLGNVGAGAYDGVGGRVLVMAS